MADVASLKKDYQKVVDKYSPKNTVFKNSFRAFWVGGSFCVLGQVLTTLYSQFDFSEADAGTMATMTLILISAVLTGLNIYDKIGNYAGGGSIIPITGFANSMVSAAMEYKKEGYVYGIGTRLFSVAGPVIVYGIIASVIIGFMYYVIG